MGTTADKLTYLNETKNILKTNLINKEVSVPSGTTFRQMAEMVGKITSASKYKITVKANNGVFSIDINNHTVNSNESYEFEVEAGEIVNFNIASDVGFSLIRNESRIEIPYIAGITTRVLPPISQFYYFIMPKGDATLEGP